MLKEGDIRLTYYRSQIEKLENENYELRGCTGYCFIEDKEIIKIYLNPIIDENICDMSNNKSDRIAFPKFYVKKRNMYYAEVMDYILCPKFFYALAGNSTFLEKLFDNYQVMVNEIKRFPNIYMSDLDFHGNVLYQDKNGFYLIDTTKWRYDDYPHMERENIKMFNKALFDALKLYLYGDIDDRVFQYEIQEMYQGIKTLNEGKELLEIMGSSLKGEYDIISFLKAYVNVVRIYCNGHIETTENMQKYVKILKNS